MNDQNPLVSICIPCYNSANFVATTIKSLLSQTYTNIEIIIVEDGSSQSSEKIISSITDIRIKYFWKKNGGAGAARNFAFKQSKGEFIKFMDADDLLNPDALKAQVNLALSNQNAIISGKWGRFYDNDLSTFKLAPESVWRDMNGVKWIIESWIQGPNMTQPGIFLLPREHIEKYGIWREDLSKGPIDDMEFFTRMIVNCSSIIFCENSVLYYRSGIQNSLSKKQSEHAMKVAFETIRISASHLLEKQNTPDSKKSISVQLQILLYNVYPHYINLYRNILTAQKEFGENDYQFPAGKVTQWISSIFGWKFSKVVKHKLKLG